MNRKRAKYRKMPVGRSMTVPLEVINTSDGLVTGIHLCMSCVAHEEVEPHQGITSKLDGKTYTCLKKRQTGAGFIWPGSKKDGMCIACPGYEPKNKDQELQRQDR